MIGKIHSMKITQFIRFFTHKMMASTNTVNDKVLKENDEREAQYPGSLE